MLSHFYSLFQHLLNEFITYLIYPLIIPPEGFVRGLGGFDRDPSVISSSYSNVNGDFVNPKIKSVGIMQNLIPHILKEKALKFCIKNVHDWENLDTDLQEWNLENTVKLFLENEEVLKQLFEKQMN